MSRYTSRDYDIIRAEISRDEDMIWDIALHGDYSTQRLLHEEYRVEYEEIYNLALVALMVQTNRDGFSYMLKYIHPIHNYISDKESLTDEDIDYAFENLLAYQYDATRTYYRYMYDTNRTFRELADEV